MVISFVSFVIVTWQNITFPKGPHRHHQNHHLRHHCHCYLAENGLSRRSIVHLLNCICRQSPSHLFFTVTIILSFTDFVLFLNRFKLNQSVHASVFLHPDYFKLPALHLLTIVIDNTVLLIHHLKLQFVFPTSPGSFSRKLAT